MAEENVLRRFFGVIFDVGDFPQIDRLAVKDTHDDVAGLLRIGKKAACLDHGFTIVTGDSTGNALPVRLSEHWHNLGRGKIAGSQARRIKQHAQLSFCAADDGGLRDQRHLFHRIVHLGHQAAEG